MIRPADDKDEPSGKGPKGDRNSKGQFLKGQYKGGPGNPYAKQLGSWRKALSDAVTPEDIKEVVCVLVRHAKAGEPWAVRELLDRTLGKPRPTDEDRDADAGLDRIVVVTVPNESEFRLRN